MKAWLLLAILVSGCAVTPRNPEQWMANERNACLPTAVSMAEGLKRQGIQAKVVRYAYTNADGSELGFFKKLLSFNFSDSKDPKAEKYQIVLTVDGNITKLAVKNSKGEVDISETAQNMIKVLANDLK
jgi:uncharacterized lipoprotein